MENVFEFFEETEEQVKESIKTTKEIIELFEKFRADLREIITKEHGIGSDDTASRDAIITWITNKLTTENI